MSKRLIIGLGNPGSEYEQTRHNVGFMVMDAMADKTSTSFRPPKAGTRWTEKFASSPRSYDVAEGAFRGRAFVLVKPQTFMNRSGSAVKRAVKRYGVDLSDILIIYDDINLPLGSIRLRGNGGAGGHNGLEDILEILNSDNLPRMRVGIGDNFTRGQQTDYVLAPFDNDEMPVVEEAIHLARDAAFTFMRDGIVTAMNRFNRRRPFSSET
jgi:peptidyl-tRNA hydrolase, PTH1 family